MLNVFFLVLPLKVLALAVMLLLYGMVVANGGSLLLDAISPPRSSAAGSVAVSERETSQAKTEPPTAKRLRDLRRKGQVAKEPGYCRDRRGSSPASAFCCSPANTCSSA